MADVLTTAYTVLCPHNGAITFTSTATLVVDGAPVVRMTDLVVPPAKIVCPAQTKCVSIAGTASSTVFDGTAAVVLVTGLKTNNEACKVTPPLNLLLDAE